MRKQMTWKLLMSGSGAVALLLLPTLNAQAFNLGIALDGFMTTLETSVTGAGLLIGLIGGAGMVVAKLENAYGQFFSGFLNYFVTAGILGGLATILGVLGLTSGATLGL